MADDISIDRAANYRHAYFDVGVHSRRRIHDQRSFLRNHLAGDMTVDAEHVLETDLSVQLWFGIGHRVSRSLPDVERATIRAQLSGDYSVHWHPAAVSCFTHNHWNLGLKMET